MTEFSSPDLSDLDHVTWSDIFSASCPTLAFDRLPSTTVEALQFVFGLVVNEALKYTSEPLRGERGWKALLLLPFLLFQPVLPGKPRKPIQKAIQNRLALLLRGRWQQARMEASQNALTLTSMRSQDTSAAEHRKLKRAQSLVRKGELSRASNILASSSTVLDPDSPDVAVELRKLFPSVNDNSDDDLNLGEVSLTPLDPASKDASSPPKSAAPVPPQAGASPASPAATASEEDEITAETLRSALAKSTTASAGPTGWHINTIKMICKRQAALQLSAKLLTNLIRATVPPVLLSTITTGILTPLSKPNSGVRPIVCCDSWLRLLSKCVVEEEQRTLANHLVPLQVGVGTPGGTELVIHSVRAALDQNKDWCAITIDCRNAYGSIHRSAIHNQLDHLTQVTRTSLVQKYFQLFAEPSSPILTRGSLRLKASQGVFQGDPLSPLLFSIGLDPVLKAVNRQLLLADPNAIMFAYLDDVTLVGPPEAVFPAFSQFSDLALQSGLQVNNDKTKVLDTNSSPEIAALANHFSLPPPESAIQILGTAVGLPEGEKSLSTSSINKEMYDNLKRLPDKQSRLLLLRHWLSKVTNHFARTLPPSSSLPSLNHHDKLVMDVLRTITDSEANEITPQLRQEISLPLRLGGLDVGQLSERRHICYLASCALAISTWQHWVPTTHQLLQGWTKGASPVSVQLQEALHKSSQVVSSYCNLKERTPTSGMSTLALPDRAEGLLRFNNPDRLQQKLTTLDSKVKLEEILSAYLKTNRDKAQFLSKLGPGAAAVFFAIPSERSLQISNDDFSVITRLWLRLPLIGHLDMEPNTPCSCTRPSKGTQVICTDDHLLLCNSGGSFSRRHDAIVREIATLLKTCGLQFELEPHVDPTGSCQLRYDITVFGATDANSKIHLDVSVRNPLASDIVVQAATRPLCAADKGVEEKYNLYSDFVGAGDLFIPLVFETFGAMHSGIQQFLACVGGRTGQEPPPSATWAAPTFGAYQLQRFSAALWRENARCARRVATQAKLQLFAGSLTDSEGRLLLAEA